MTSHQRNALSTLATLHANEPNRQSFPTKSIGSYAVVVRLSRMGLVERRQLGTWKITEAGQAALGQC